MKAEVSTTCRELAMKLAWAGVEIRYDRDEQRRVRWWFPAWVGRVQMLMNAASIPPAHFRFVIAVLTKDEARRDILLSADARAIRIQLVAIVAEAT